MVAKLKDNLSEIYLGLLLFVVLPVVAGLYFDYRAALLLSAVSQVIIGILYIRGK